MKSYIIENGVLIEYKGNAKHAIIPNGVISIGKNAFKYNNGLTSIVIPSSVTSIGYATFYGCTGLTSIVIPSSVKSIGDSAFYNCTSLTSINLSNNVTRIGGFAFSNCTNLTSINIPNNVKSIECSAFDGCTGLTSINIPNSVTYIGYYVFDKIKKIKPQYKSNGTLRAYKGFNKGFLSDWTCRGFKYEIGKSYHQDGKIKCCENGFHACPNPLDVFNYYRGILNGLHFAEVELSGEMDWVKDKVAASDIRIIRELTASELAEIYNNMEKE